ncbi:MAG TPA: hypothetical protein VGP92_06990 [Acidimicrobiia bacterium]|nr:hypothetical protein [Acidimicrobiia bacterium]
MSTTRTRTRARLLCVATATLSFGFVPQAASAQFAPVLPVARAEPKNAPTCTAAQSRSLQAADAGTPSAAAKSRPAEWFAANECAPPTVTQIARAPDEIRTLGRVVGPGDTSFQVRRTSHMIWNGIPGRVALTPAQQRQYTQAALTAPTRVAACCSTIQGPLYRDARWHCSAWRFRNDYYSLPADRLSWTIYSYLAYCTIASSIFGGVVQGNLGGRPYDRPPASWALCSPHNGTIGSGDPDRRGCWASMTRISFYRRWFSGDRSDTSSRSGFWISHAQVVTDVYNPFLPDQCFLGRITAEFHIHANHVLSWDADLANDPPGIQWCPWHRRSAS